MKQETTKPEQHSNTPELGLHSVMHWVSVKEKLPETNCDVLAVKKNGKVYQMSFHAPFDSGKRIFQWWGFGAWIDQHKQVTHWMLIPEPPCA